MIAYGADALNPEGVITVEGELTVDSASEFRAALIGSLKGLDALRVDITKVSEVDLTCLQLLCSACRGAQGLNKGVELRGVSSVFTQAVISAGVCQRDGCASGGDKACIWLTGDNHG
jgi:ABC-type transporter Mla MlaB component